MKICSQNHWHLFAVLLILAEGDNSGCIEILATIFSYILLIVTMPFSLFVCFKVVSEYERAVIFRMGRLRLVYTKKNSELTLKILAKTLFTIDPARKSFSKMKFTVNHSEIIRAYTNDSERLQKYP